MVKVEIMKRFYIPFYNRMLLVCILVNSFSAFSQDTLISALPVKEKIRQYEKTIYIEASSDSVFAFMDDVKNTGSHMTKKNGAMMGSKLSFKWLTQNQAGIGATYQWNGKVMWMKMDFTVQVFQWQSGKDKTWGTIGNSKMIVIDWFEMHLITSPITSEKTEVRLEIKYTKSKNIKGFLLGKLYAKWCVKKMLKDSKKHFNMRNTD